MPRTFKSVMIELPLNIKYGDKNLRTELFKGNK